MSIHKIKEDMVSPSHYVAVLKIDMKDVIEVVEAGWEYKILDDDSWKHGTPRGEEHRKAYQRLARAYKRIGMTRTAPP